MVSLYKINLEVNKMNGRDCAESFCVIVGTINLLRICRFRTQIF